MEDAEWATSQEIAGYLERKADSHKAELASRFFKTAEGQYGYGDRFLGISVPAVRQVVKKYRNASINVAKKLLKSEYHEVRLFALLLLVERFSQGSAREREEIYHTYLAHTPYVNNWDLVDSSAYHIVGAYLENHDTSVLDDLARSDSLWERRIAIIATFHFIRKSRFGEALRIAEQLLGDREDLIHKAVGWMLREVGKRDLNAEENFLKTHYRSMPRTMLRYAIEKFNREQRLKYLQGEL
jgi:3-methyladenine DNA glycosylase AlkD